MKTGSQRAGGRLHSRACAELGNRVMSKQEVMRANQEMLELELSFVSWTLFRISHVRGEEFAREVAIAQEAFAVLCRLNGKGDGFH